MKGEWFVSVASPEEGTSPYYWARVEKDGDRVKVWIPRYDDFEALVEEKKLRGEIEGGFEYTVTLDRLDPKAIELLSSHRMPAFVVELRRIGR